MTAERRELSTKDLANANDENSDDRAAVIDRNHPGDAQAPVVLFPDEEGRRFRTRWTDVQATFVDAPRDAVQHADALVAEVMTRITNVFADERANLERQWDRGDQVTTEDLRVALQRYRAFFDRLLSL